MERDKIIKFNRGYLSDLINFQIKCELKNYIWEKFDEIYGNPGVIGSFQQNKSWESDMQHVKGRINSDPTKWDLNNLVAIFCQFAQNQKFYEDFLPECQPD